MRNGSGLAVLPRYRWNPSGDFKDGPEQDAAVVAAQKAFEGNVLGSTDEMGPDTPLVIAGRAWLEGIGRLDGGLATKTVSDYHAVWYRCIDVEGSSLRGLSLDQANNPQRLRAFLRKLADEHGTGSAKMARSALSGVFRLAVSNGALQTNALRQVGRVQTQVPRAIKRRSGQPRDTTRAFSREERDAIVAFADGLANEANLNPRTQRKRESVADVLAFLSGTGVRIAEARQLRWADVDLDAGRVAIMGTKSRAAERTLDLPEMADRPNAATGGQSRRRGLCICLASSHRRVGRHPMGSKQSGSGPRHDDHDGGLWLGNTP